MTFSVASEGLRHPQIVVVVQAFHRVLQAQASVRGLEMALSVHSRQVSLALAEMVTETASAMSPNS